MFGLTQKKVVDFHKNSRITVISFDRETGVREMTYGNLNPTAAIDHIMRKTALGCEVLCFTPEAYKQLPFEFGTERRAKGLGRITYAEALPFATSGLK